MLNSGDGADIQLKCGGDSIPVHKNILSARSPVLAAMFSRGMAEAEASEATLQGIEPPVMRSLVHFIYTDELDKRGKGFAAELLAAADQYELPRLVSLCENQLVKSIDDKSAVARLMLAERHHSNRLKLVCMNYIAMNGAEVMKTEGWKLLQTETKLLQELFAETQKKRKSPWD